MRLLSQNGNCDNYQCEKFLTGATNFSIAASIVQNLFLGKSALLFTLPKLSLSKWQFFLAGRLQ
jgi:3-oxoacyl-ACP reductase-like protein